jgi:ABC-2 type transport system permease protein
VCSAYGFNFFAQIGLPVIPFILALCLMGWAIGIFTTALILRLGQGAEELAWALAFLFQPFSAVFYPVSNLPGAMRVIAFWIPASHVFEGLRAIIIEGAGFPTTERVWAFAIDALYMAFAVWLFRWALRQVRERGLLARFGE